MKSRYLAAVLLIFALLAALPGCGATRYEDGAYYAEMDDFADSGWKEIVELTILDGKIQRINWDAVYVDDSIPIRKKQYSKSGLYGMLMAGAANEWYDQAVAAEQYVLENGIDALNVDSDGRTDAVSGCTVHVDSFDLLLRECLAQAEKK
jgi:major membrane immunogen (membrane-anchored lipoprotein)